MTWSGLSGELTTSSATFSYKPNTTDQNTVGSQSAGYELVNGSVNAGSLMVASPDAIKAGSRRRDQMRGRRLADQKAVEVLLHSMIGPCHALVLAQMLEP